MREQLLPFQISGRRLDYSINDAETIGDLIGKKNKIRSYFIPYTKRNSRWLELIVKKKKNEAMKWLGENYRWIYSSREKNKSQNQKLIVVDI